MALRALPRAGQKPVLCRVHRIALRADPFLHGFCLPQFLRRGYDEISDG